jgi:hypothetical protein
MPLAAIRAYLQNLEAVQAEASIQAATVADFPHLDQSARDSRFRRWQSAIDSSRWMSALPASPGLLALAGIGYRHAAPAQPAAGSEESDGLGQDPTVPSSEPIRP